MLHQHASPVGFATAAAMWFAMMAAMMAPAAWPWVRSFRRFGAADGHSQFGATVLFAVGYLAAWLGYSIVAAAIQRMVPPPSAWAPVVFILAGAFQLAPMKRACLTHCRSPFSFFLTRWRNGPAGSFRMGVEHGVFCVGCCWALMATMLVVGVTNAWWMAALAAVAFIEQVAPHGYRLRVPIGVALMAAAARAWQP